MADGRTNDTQSEMDISDMTEQGRIRRAKLEQLRSEGADPFTQTAYDVTHLSADITGGFDALEGSTVSIAGRMLSRRVMGKAAFAHIADRAGRIQIYIKQDEMGPEAYQAFKELDIGDILGVRGEVFRTARGEISVKASGYTLLSKSLLPLPEKYHGLKDPDLRYRQRYLDLMLNEDVRRTFITRSRIIKGMREFLDARGFLEVETPVLQQIDTGAEARPFKTFHNTLGISLHLRIELELYLKRLVVGGLDRVYEIGRLFRNEGMSVKHNPEFTMLELYQAYTDYNGMMALVEEMYEALARDITGSAKVTYQGVELDFTAPWPRMTMAEAVRQHCGADYNAWRGDAGAREAARALGVEPDDGATRGDVLSVLFEAFAEDKLIQPIFITDYPIEISPLAKRRRDNDMLVERFEFFIYGREGGNAFSELNDPVDQRRRFEYQVQHVKRKDNEAQVDEDFVTAMEYGLPPTGGVGCGVDRLVMLLTNSPSIRDVILFPTMKPVDK